MNFFRKSEPRNFRVLNIKYGSFCHRITENSLATSNLYFANILPCPQSLCIETSFFDHYHESNKNFHFVWPKHRFFGFGCIWRRISSWLFFIITSRLFEVVLTLKWPLAWNNFFGGPFEGQNDLRLPWFYYKNNQPGILRGVLPVPKNRFSGHLQ